MEKYFDSGSYNGFRDKFLKNTPWPGNRYVTITLFWKYILKSLIEVVLMYKINRRVGEEYDPNGRYYVNYAFALLYK